MSTFAHLWLYCDDFQRLKALDDGWTDLQKMWDTKQSLFTQSNQLLVSDCDIVNSCVHEYNDLLQLCHDWVAAG